MTAKNNYIHVYFLLYSVLVVYGENAEVVTTHGKLKGAVLKTLYKNVDYFGFMGIPYAAPPLGELRFLPPQPIEPWTGVKSATKEKKACFQFNNNVKKAELGHYGVEDCLYLDIFTPGIDDAKRNVIMFIYNEHFTNSYNKSKDYQPDFFIEEDVIVVTISHRLTALGFLSLEDEVLWGNSGLKDIVQGLEWVRDNIEKFGGDRDKITLMGFAEGASLVDILMHSTKKALFKSAILHSGTAWSTSTLQVGVRERAFELARLFGKHPTTSKSVIEELNNIPAQNITARDLHANPKDYFKETQRTVSTFGPIVEKDPNGLIVDYPENSTEIDKPILMGINSREGLELSLHYLVEPRYMSFLKKDFPLLMPIRLNFSFDPLKEGYYDAVEDIKKQYFKEGIKIKRVTDFINYIGDVYSGYVTDYVAKRYAKISKEPLYFYHFDFNGEFNENKNSLMKFSTVKDGIWGNALGDELCYLFKCPSLKDIYVKHNEEMTNDRIVQRKMVRMWTNFVKYGDPTPVGDAILEDLKWPAYDVELNQYLDIRKTMDIKRNLNKDRYQFWNEFFAKWQQKAVNGIVGDSPILKDEL